MIDMGSDGGVYECIEAVLNRKLPPNYLPQPSRLFSPAGLKVFSFLCQNISRSRNIFFFSSVLFRSSQHFSCSMGIISRCFSMLQLDDSMKCLTSIHVPFLILRWCRLLFILMLSFASLLPTYCFLCKVHWHRYITHCEQQFILWKIL